MDILVGTCAIAVLVHCSRLEDKPSILSRVLSTRFFGWAGGFSYSLYLIHFPLQQLLWQYLVRPLNFEKNIQFIVMSVVGTPILIGLSRLFYQICEKPFTKSWGSKSKPQSVV